MRFIGDFKIKQELGRGGMGVVYLARQLSLARDVALKVLSAEASADSRLILRFQREAALLGRMAHPHIVRVFVVGEEDGQHFLAMEYIEGTDLSKLLLARQQSGPSALPEAFQGDFQRAVVGAGRDTARALAAAHAEGIVHRDVKPSNILIADSGRVLLADFGLARDLSAQALTRTGTTLGTPFYMSPEIYRSVRFAPASDVYALGAVLYESVVGRRPFEDESAERLMRKILDVDPVPPRKVDAGIPRDLETIILRCLEKDPEMRYPDGAALEADLSRYLAGEPIAADPVGALTRFVRRTRRRRTSLLALVAAVLVAALFFGWAWTERSTRRQQRVVGEVENALNADQTALALGLMDDELKDHPAHERVRFERADLALKEKRWADAAADFEYLAEHSGEESVAAGLAARLAREIAASPSARGVSAAPDREPTTAREAFYIGLIHQARQELVESNESNRRALELDPDLLEARYSLGAVHFKLGEYDQAEEALVAYDRVRSRASVMKLLGRIDMEKERFESACVNFGRYTRAMPDDVVGWNNLAAAHTSRAMECADIGFVDRYDRERAAAGGALDKAREIDPDYFQITFNDAMLHLLDREVERAEELFQSAIMKARQTGGVDRSVYVQMWTHFPGILSWIGRYERALFYLDGIRGADPSITDELLWIIAFAEAASHTGRAEEVRPILDQALAGAHADSEKLQSLRLQLFEE